DVDVGNTAVAADRGEEQFGVLQAIGEQRRRQAVRRSVLLCQGLAQRVDVDDVENRREGFRLHDRPVVLRPNDGGLDVVSGLRFPAAEDFTTGGLCRGDGCLVALDRAWV